MRKARIVSDPKTLGGKPIIAGTRISVELVMDLLASGLEVRDIVREYPHLTPADIQAVISFVAAKFKNEELRPVVKKNGEIFFPAL